ncbi:MAG: apolipoprotein N-acyltransferase [Bacteroidales bacterium]|nr:apolipoprotein N-acyltransferase [Bacteroidales bacterium]
MKKYRNLLLSVLSGLLLAAAWPTYGFAPIVFVAFVPLLIIEKDLGANTKHGSWIIMLYSFIAFLIFNSITTWWICYASGVGGILACVLNAFLMTLTFQIYHFVRFNAFDKNKGQLALIPFWIGFEKLHYTWEINWPWLNLGNVFATSPSLIQWYSITGVEGGTLWVLLTNILIFKAIDKFINEHDTKELLRKMIAPVCFIIIPIVISVIMFNSYKEESRPIDVVVYQPNSDPYHEQYTLTEAEVLGRFTAMTKPLVDSNTDFIVCPESMMQTRTWENDLSQCNYINYYREYLRENAPGAAVIVGTSTYRLYDKGEEHPASARDRGNGTFYDAYNTNMFIDTTETLQLHHKSKLTPGVEIMPYIRYMPFIENLALDLGGTVGTLGTDKEIIPFWSMNSRAVIGSVICYESVFGAHVAQYVRNNANVLFISTNDGWWRDTQGYRQHCAYASILAIEHRRSIARSANTGISCIVDQRGVITHQTPYWKPDVFKATINLNDKVTFYSRFGDWLADIAVSMILALVVISIINSIANRRNRI